MCFFSLVKWKRYICLGYNSFLAVDIIINLASYFSFVLFIAPINSVTLVFYFLATEGSKSLKSEASESGKQETTAADPDLNMINSYLEDTSEIRAVPEAFYATLQLVFRIRMGVDTGTC